MRRKKVPFCRPQRNLASIEAVQRRNRRQSVRIARAVRNADQLRLARIAQTVNQLQRAGVVAIGSEIGIKE